MEMTMINTVKRRVYIRYFKDFILISLGVIMASIGLKGFLLPNGFLDGGAMGVSLLLNIFTKIDLGILIIAVNLPFIIISVRQISKEFALKSILAIIVLSLLVHFLQLPIFTKDTLLIAVFGGFFLGAGIGFAIRGGAVIDGTEVMAITVSRRSSLTVGDFIAVFNTILFLIAALLLNIETAMYSILTYLSASKTVDFIINGIEEYIGVYVVSPKAEEIKTQITEYLGKGVTVFKTDKGYGQRGDFEHEGGRALFCVVTRLEVTKLILEIEKIDARAFIVQHSINDIKGGMVKKRPLH